MCKQRCKICLAEFRQLAVHVSIVHQTVFKDYRKEYGVGKESFINLVHHKCGVCGTEMVFDYKTVQDHVRYRHKLLRFKEYKEINFELY